MNKSIFGIVLLAFSLFACGTPTGTSDVAAKVQDPTCSPQDTPAGSASAGAAGSTGVAGPAGPIGPQGKDGLMGPEGPVGPQGLPGTSAAKGDPGATGPMGPAGPAGAPGPQGIQGVPGAVGAAGPASSPFHIATMYTKESPAVFGVDPTGSQTQWCNAGDIAIGGGCLPLNDVTHSTAMRGFGTQLDAANNRMGYNCSGFSSTSTGAMSVFVICHVVAP